MDITNKDFSKGITYKDSSRPFEMNLENKKNAKEIIKKWKIQEEISVCDSTSSPAFEGAKIVLEDVKVLDKPIEKMDLQTIQKKYFKLSNEIESLEMSLWNEIEMFSISTDYLRSNNNYLIYRSLLPLDMNDKTAFEQYVKYCRDYIETKTNEKKSIFFDIAKLENESKLANKKTKDLKKIEKVGKIEEGLPKDWIPKDIMDGFTGQIEF